MPSADIVAYRVGTENLCPCCAARTVGCNDGDPHVHIETAGLTAGIDIHDESSFDSHDWPKAIFDSQVNDADPCAGCGDNLNWFGSYRRSPQNR